MDSLSLSYFLNTALNAGIAFFATRRSPQTRNGTTTTNVRASFPPMINAIIIEKMNISGLRTAVLIIIINDICTFDTSVVSLVTSEAEENLSMFSNENV